jgi:hypothetical protein
MGQCIYVRERGGPLERGQEPLAREMPSEVWMSPEDAGRILGEGQFMNTTIGIWLYESDVWDKASLRKRLLALVDHVTSPTFMAEYEEWGRRQLGPRTEK